MLDATSEQSLPHKSKRYVYGHAFYAVHPNFVERLKFDVEKLRPIGTTDYAILLNAELAVKSNIYRYNNLLVKTINNFTALDLDKSRVFQLDLILRIVELNSKDALDKETIVGNLYMKPNENKKPLLTTTLLTMLQNNSKVNNEEEIAAISSCQSN